MVELVTASVFNRFMSSGRTSPMLATCFGRGSDVDVVVKLNGFMDFGTRGAVFEFVASLMAARIGIDRPKPFVVRLNEEFVNVVTLLFPEKALALRKSVGLNFGTEMMKGIIIFGEAMTVSQSALCDALRVFAFDGLNSKPRPISGESKSLCA